MSESSPRRARLWRYLGYAAGALLLFALVLVAGTWLAVRVWGPEFARARLETALTSALGRATRVERIAVEPWFGRVVIENVTVGALPGEPGPHFFKLGRLDVNLGISSLWRRRLVLRSIRLDDLDLAIRAGGGPALREIPMLPAVVQAGPVEVELGTLELHRGRLVYDDAATSTRITVPGITASLQPGRDAMSATFTVPELGLDVEKIHERVEQVEAEVRIAPTRLEIRRLAATWEKARITVAGRADGPFDHTRVELRVRGDIDVASVGRRVGSTVPLDGVVRIDGRLEGSAVSPRVAADVAIDELTAGPVKARAAKAHVALADGVLSVTKLDARAFDGAVTGSLTLELERVDRAHAVLALRGISLAALEPLAGIKAGAAGRLDGDVDARGDLRDLLHAQSKVRLLARELRLPGRLASLGSGTVDAEGYGQQGTFTLSHGVASWPGLKVDAQGQATVEGPKGLRLTATGALAKLGPLIGRSVSGNAVLAADVIGRWRDPSLTGKLELRSPAVADLRADEIVLPFELTQRSLRLAAASVRLGRARVVASGNLAWPQTASAAIPAVDTVGVDLQAQTEDARLEDAWPWLPPAGRGSGPVRASVVMRGTLAAWRATGQLESSGLTWPAIPAARDLSATFEATPDRIEVSVFKTVVLDAPLTARGRWRWAGGGEVEGSTGLVDLARLPGVPTQLRVEGRARANVSASVRDGRVNGSGKVIGERLAVAGWALGAGTADVSLDDNALRGEAALPEARITASAQGRLDGVIATRLTATDFEIGPILRQLRPDLFGDAAGRLSAAATLDVPARDPRAARGLIRLEPVRLEIAGESWEAQGPIVVRREPGRLTVERLEIAGRLGTATATGWLDDAGALEGTLRGQVPLALLAVLRREVRDASGKLDLDVRVGGTLAKPTLLGRGTISGGVIALRDLPFVVRDLEGRLALSPARLRIEELKAGIGTGTARATGEIALDGGTVGAYQVALTAQRVGLTPVEGLETVWNAELALVGRGARGLVRGEAHLVRGMYTRDLSILPLLLKTGGRAEPAEWGRAIGLQVQVLLDDNLVIRSPQAQVRGGGTLALRGTVAQPTILGTVETQDGRVTFRRNRFVLENAVVRFDDPERINPYLDLRATTRIRTYDVTMWLSGRADDLTIRLASEPPLSQEDLLALVTVGATRSELGSSGGGTVFATEAAQLISKELLGGELNAPTVDILEFGKNEEGQSEFRVGKRLNDRTLVTYSGSFAEGGKQKLRVEYQLFGPVLIAGEQAFSGGVGGDVILRFRFR
jgi:translocation-and-assembly-module (TAM) inner membrane subunit TamB-like protein